MKGSWMTRIAVRGNDYLPASVVSGAVFRLQLEALQPIIASGSGSRPFARFPPSHLRNAARIVSSQARLKSNCSAIAEIRFMNSPMRMSEDCISLALDQRGRVLLRPKSEQCRKHRVVSQPVDVDVPRKSADDREHSRADDQAWRWRRFKTAFMRCRWMWEGTTAGEPSRMASSGPDVAPSAWPLWSKASRSDKIVI